MKAAVENIHAEITEPEITDDELDQNAEPLPADPNVKNFSYTNVDGQVYYRENSYMNKVDLPAVTAERVLGMIALRETTQKLLDCQLHDGTDAEVELLQGKLKDQYKRFTAQYGLINSTANKRAFRQDSSYCLLASLEILDEDKNLKRLADIFTKRTIRKPEPVTSVDTPSEALALSIGEKAKVDVPFIFRMWWQNEYQSVCGLSAERKCRTCCVSVTFISVFDGTSFSGDRTKLSAGVFYQVVYIGHTRDDSETVGRASTEEFPWPSIWCR